MLNATFVQLRGNNLGSEGAERFGYHISKAPHLTALTVIFEF